MADEAIVSFMVPHFGSTTYLRAAVESVLAQSDDRWLLTVVEDGEHPGVGTWLRSLGDPRISHESNPVRLGVGGNFQRCLELARAPYVTFLGNDDVLLPNYVRTIASGIAAFPAATVLQPRVRVIDADGRPCRPVGDRVKARLAPRTAQPIELSGERAVTSLLHGTWTYFPALCWRRDQLPVSGFRQDLPTTLDLALLTEVLLSGATMVVLPDLAFEYRRHDASASSVAAHDTERFAEEAGLLNELAERCHARGWERACRAARLRATSRLHAAQVGLAAARHRDWSRSTAAFSHVLSSPAHRASRVVTSGRA